MDAAQCNHSKYRLEGKKLFCLTCTHTAYLVEVPLCAICFQTPCICKLEQSANLPVKLADDQSVFEFVCTNCNNTFDGISSGVLLTPDSRVICPDCYQKLNPNLHDEIQS